MWPLLKHNLSCVHGTKSEKEEVKTDWLLLLNNESNSSRFNSLTHKFAEIWLIEVEKWKIARLRKMFFRFQKFSSQFAMPLYLFLFFFCKVLFSVWRTSYQNPIVTSLTIQLVSNSAENFFLHPEAGFLTFFRIIIEKCRSIHVGIWWLYEKPLSKRKDNERKLWLLWIMNIPALLTWHILLYTKI